MAQQKPWQPFPFGQIGYYISENREFFSFSADSLLIHPDGDTVIYFNRKVYDGEPLCTQPGSILWGEYWHSYYKPFVQDSIRVSGDTVWFNRFSTFDKQWIFDVAVLQPMHEGYAWDSIWFDVELQDSVRRISLFNGSGQLLYPDTLRISKYHGWVKWNLDDHSVCPAVTQSVQMKICGFRNDSFHWGFEVPAVERYFEYYPGDILRWKHEQGSWMGIYAQQESRDSVISVDYSPSTVTLHTWRTKRSFSIDSTLDETAAPGTWTFQLNAYKQAATRTTAFPALDLEDNSTIYGIRLFSNVIGCSADTIMSLHWGGGHMDQDSCDFEMYFDQEYSWNFSTKRGYLGMYDYYPVNGSYGFTSQTGYYSPTKGIACGNWYPLSASAPVRHLNISVIPNPAIDNLNIIFHQPVSGSLQIVDATGRTLDIETLNGNSPAKADKLVAIDVSRFTSGFYFIRVVSGSNVYTTKFVKQ